MLEVEFHSKFTAWTTSDHSRQYDNPEELLARIGRYAPYRCRAAHDLPWEHLPNLAFPKRYKTGVEGNFGWYLQLDSIPPSGFPVLDCVYMVEITEPPICPTETPMTTPTSPAEPNSSIDALVDIKIGRGKQDGKLTLEINASNLHALLDSMGARVSDGKYVDRPACSYSSIASGNKLSTELFLKQEYPVKLALGPCYERPPTIQQLKALCESGHVAVQTILAHYQPVDITYRIVKVIK